jgi:hypothetical protein
VCGNSKRSNADLSIAAQNRTLLNNCGSIMSRPSLLAFEIDL